MSGTTLFAGGGFTSIGGQARNYLAALDTTLPTNNATPFNPAANGPIAALALSGATLYVGGLFTSIGDQTRIALAAFNAPPQVTTTSLPAARYQQPYQQQVVVSGLPRTRVSIDSGALPPGLGLDDSGLISGTPTLGGTFTVTLRAANGVPPDAIQTFTLSVSPGPSAFIPLLVR